MSASQGKPDVSNLASGDIRLAVDKLGTHDPDHQSLDKDPQLQEEHNETSKKSWFNKKQKVSTAEELEEEEKKKKAAEGQTFGNYFVCA